jgi:CheY-like chemotaxis protein
MPLILAIEPDKRQAAHITSMARHRLHVELVLADSAERALTVLGDRVPDLILTPALLPPQDEAALADHLRELDERAAHVQTLTVPLLASTPPASRARGMLAALRREKPGASADGCDPAVFAEQITAYLERAAIERKTREPVQDDESAPAAPPKSPAPMVAEIAEPVISEAAAPMMAEVVAGKAPTFDLAEMSGGLQLDSMETLDVPELEVISVDDEPAGEDEDEEDAADEIDLAPFLDHERPETTGAPAAAIMAAVAAAERMMQVETRLPAPEVEPWMPLRFRPQPAWPSLDGTEAEAVAAPDGRPRDLGALAPTKKQAAKAAPVQDEWGLFDPAQCGFAALLAKLEELTEKDDAKSA